MIRQNIIGHGCIPSINQARRSARFVKIPSARYPAATDFAQAWPLIPLHDLTDDTGIDPSISCSACAAKCCRLEVMLITDTGVPERFIETDDWGSQTMARLDDGWCAALDRHSMGCSIYELRPLICREFDMGGYDCQEERLRA